MRSFVVVAFCLGLFAMAQALEQTEGVLLMGLTADEDMSKVGNVSVLDGHHHGHWHRHHRHHDPSDRAYWERRHSAKSELLRCLQNAHDDCDISSTYSLKATGKRIAHCLLDHLGGCHDVPGLGIDITSKIPFIMAANGFETLLKAGPSGLAHAGLVFEFYLAGATPKTNNPWYIEGGCASQLYSLLATGCQGAGIKQIHALAEVVANFIKKLMSDTSDPNFGLGKCAPDVPAVLVSLFTTSCPEHGYLYNPLTGKRTTCTYQSNAQYEKSAAALLGGSVYSLLLLSGNTKIAGLGVQIAFAGLRFALAATQTTDFYKCLDLENTPTVLNPFPQLTNGYYKGQLWNALSNKEDSPNSVTDGVPVYSGRILTNPPAYTPLPLRPDGARVICASIAMMSGDPTDPKYVTNGGWQKYMMWQGAADITNALYGTINAYPTKISTPATQGLCLATRAIYTFSTQPTPDANNNAVVAVIFPPLANFEVGRTCWTSQRPCDPDVNVHWVVAGGFTVPPLPTLASPFHDLGPTSPFVEVCTKAFQ